jgi:lysozyme
MNLQKLLMRHEGLRLTPYQCPEGFWTVGYGHNLNAHGELIPESITEEQAIQYLEQDMIDAQRECASKIPCWSKLNEVRKTVLIDMAFNMGIGTSGVDGLLSFTHMLAYLEVGDYQNAAIEMLSSKWARQVKTRATELARMMITGEWI